MNNLRSLPERMNTWPKKNIMTMTGGVTQQTVPPGAKWQVESLSSGTAERAQVRTKTDFENVLNSCSRKTTEILVLPV